MNAVLFPHLCRSHKSITSATLIGFSVCKFIYTPGVCSISGVLPGMGRLRFVMTASAAHRDEVHGGCAENHFAPWLAAEAEKWISQEQWEYLLSY